MLKTSQLIKLLQEADPNDECVVCVSNHPVRNVERLPYYYDGRLELIEKDEDNKPIKVGYKSGPDKIKIYYDNIEDALLDNPEAELELSGIIYEGLPDPRYMKFLNDCIAEGCKYQNRRKAYIEAKKNGTEAPSWD